MKVQVGSGMPEPRQFSLKVDDLDEMIKQNKGKTKAMHMMMLE